MDSERALLGLVDFQKKELSTLKIDGHQINYLVAGQGDPLLLIHGGNVGWGQWFENISEYAKHFKVYAIDLPGAGRSSVLDYKNFDFEKDFTTVVQHFIEELQLGSASFIGSSLGGWILIQLQKRGVIKPRKIVLANSLGFSEYMPYRQRLLSFFPLAQILSKTVLRPSVENPQIEKFLRDVFFDKEFFIPKEFLTYFTETMDRSHQLLLLSRLSHFWRMPSHYVLHDKLSCADTDVLIIWGVDDPILPYRESKKRFHLANPKEVIVFPSCGHMPAIEHSKKFNAVTLRFLLST